MKGKLLDEMHGRRTYALVFDMGDEVVAGLRAFAEEHDLRGSHFTAIGAVQHVTLGWWSWDERDYRRIEIAEQVEVLALTGNITADPNGAAHVHAHIVIGRSDGTAHGGHLLHGIVRPTLEVAITETPTRLERQHDERTGLTLIQP